MSTINFYIKDHQFLKTPHASTKPFFIANLSQQQNPDCFQNGRINLNKFYQSLIKFLINQAKVTCRFFNKNNIN
jgi:hypothetical protein